MGSKRLAQNVDEELDFRRATRRVLFDDTAIRDSVPGGASSAADDAERHVRVKVTMNLASDLVRHFKEEARKQGRAYQLLINQALREYLEGDRPEQLAKKVSTALLESEDFLAKMASRVQELAARK